MEFRSGIIAFLICAVALAIDAGSDPSEEAFQYAAITTVGAEIEVLAGRRFATRPELRVLSETDAEQFAKREAARQVGPHSLPLRLLVEKERMHERTFVRFYPLSNVVVIIPSRVQDAIRSGRFRDPASHFKLALAEQLAKALRYQRAPRVNATLDSEWNARALDIGFALALTERYTKKHLPSGTWPIEWDHVPPERPTSAPEMRYQLEYHGYHFIQRLLAGAESFAPVWNMFDGELPDRYAIRHPEEFLNGDAKPIDRDRLLKAVEVVASELPPLARAQFRKDRLDRDRLASVVADEHTSLLPRDFVEVEFLFRVAPSEELPAAMFMLFGLRNEVLAKRFVAETPSSRPVGTFYWLTPRPPDCLYELVDVSGVMGYQLRKGALVLRILTWDPAHRAAAENSLQRVWDALAP